MSILFLFLRLLFFRLDVFQLTKLLWELWTGVSDRHSDTLRAGRLWSYFGN